MTILGTAMGAVIALGSTLVNDRIKWRREQSLQKRKMLQEVYSEYLTALTEAHETMRAAVTAHGTAEERRGPVLDAFRASGAYTLRYRLAIVAGQDVLDAAEEAFRQLRGGRDLLADGNGLDSRQYKEFRTTYGGTMRELQQRIRQELREDAVSFTGGS
ncbi:hypothetical protein F0L68_26870 [Solihabitans fulvus]|uniref:Uncharacterized protein n=1 Tax=Solihabitans fulvus TaxID=1892852 RepID=A0A5B2WZA9_9PSEU|nr:hypothetical protein [Solihabitans fulvus]KAA2256072.1 hypothetical protein F0L68_26870 [Solihabitans fulvus]